MMLLQVGDFVRVRSDGVPKEQRTLAISKAVKVLGLRLGKDTDVQNIPIEGIDKDLTVALEDGRVVQGDEIVVIKKLPKPLRIVIETDGERIREHFLGR